MDSPPNSVGLPTSTAPHAGRLILPEDFWVLTYKVFGTVRPWVSRNQGASGVWTPDLTLGAACVFWFTAACLRVLRARLNLSLYIKQCINILQIAPCTNPEPHDWEDCLYAHKGEKARRRHPSLYQALQCPEARTVRLLHAGGKGPQAGTEQACVSEASSLPTICNPRKGAQVARTARVCTK